MKWLRNFGCQATQQQNCSNWKDTAEQSGFHGIYCNEYHDQLIDYSNTCTYNHISKGYCNTKKYTTALQKENQYFADPTLGGSEKVSISRINQ